MQPWEFIQLIPDPTVSIDPGFRQVGYLAFAVHPDRYELAKRAANMMPSTTESGLAILQAWIAFARSADALGKALLADLQAIAGKMAAPKPRAETTHGIGPKPSAN
jgi:hypothetical protein